MSDKFKIIVITNEDEVDDEAEKIVALLDLGVDYVHIRKPGLHIDDVKRLIEQIPYQYRSRIKLHGHFQLINEMNLGGVHINSRNSVAPYTAKSISKSCHTIDELSDVDGYEYVTLSPIFDSISKQGYIGRFDLDKITFFIDNKRVIALGGVSPDKFKLLKSKGFYGAALLGYIWGKNIDEIKEICFNI